MSTPDRSGDRLVRRSSAAPQRSDGAFPVEQPGSVIGAPVRQESQPSTSFFSRHRWPLSIGAGLVALGGSAAAVVFASGDGSGDGGVNVVTVDETATVQGPTTGTTKTSEATPSPTATSTRVAPTENPKETPIGKDGGSGTTNPATPEATATPTSTSTPLLTPTEVVPTPTPMVEIVPAPLSEIGSVVQAALRSAGVTDVNSQFDADVKSATGKSNNLTSASVLSALNSWSGILQRMIPIACLNQGDEVVRIATYSLAVEKRRVFDKGVELGRFKPADWEGAWNLAKLAMVRAGCTLPYLDRFDPANIN